MNLKIITGLISLLCFCAPAFASGPGSTTVRLRSIQNVRSANGVFSIRGYSDDARKNLVEITGDRADNDELIETAISFASNMLNSTVQEPLSLVLQLDFTNTAIGVFEAGGNLISYAVDTNRNINNVLMVRHIGFNSNFSSEDNVQETFALLMRRRDGVYVIRTSDVSGNTRQHIGNLNNDQVARDCLISGAGVLTTDGNERKAIDIQGNELSNTGNVSSSGSSSFSSYVSKLQRCSIEQSDHVINVSLVSGSLSSTVVN